MAKGTAYPKVNFVFTDAVRVIGGRYLDAWKDGSHNIKLLVPMGHQDMKDLKEAAQKAASLSGKWDGSSALYLPWVTTEVAAQKAIDEKKDPKKYQDTPGLVLNASTGYAPRVSIQTGDNIALLQGPARLNTGKAKHYIGAFVLADVSFAYYDANPMTKIPGVTAYLNEVCWVRDGQKLEEFVQSSSFKGRATAQTAASSNPFS